MRTWQVRIRSWLASDIERLPLPYRLLCGQFLLRIVDLESLSVEADVPRFLGQFAGVLIMLSLIHALFAFVTIGSSPWLVEQYLIRTMMLVAGLIVVVSWENTFPDRIDVLVLGALPLKPATIPLAKVSATLALLGLALAALNAVPGIEVPMLLGSMHRSVWGLMEAFGAYWLTMVLASVFLYGAVLTVQGTLALMLPRRFFLRVSAALQVVGFLLLLGLYFLQPMLPTYEALIAASNRPFSMWSPPLWFFGVFSQLHGDLPATLRFLAWRGWIAAAIAILGALLTLKWSYGRVMARTLEEQDLLPSQGENGSWRLPWPGGLRRAVLSFSAKALLRSRHHRVVCAFYAGVVLSIGLSSLREARSTPAPHPETLGFLMGSVAMMGLAVPGLRSLFSLPISLHANWVWRLTESHAPEQYLQATRTVLLLFAVVPVWLFVAGISCLYRPLAAAGEHLVILALLGMIFAELSLARFRKVPFACSYLPGKSNLQAVFWTAVLFLLPISAGFAIWERRALQRPAEIGGLVAGLGATVLALWLWNQAQGRTAKLDFDDAEPDLLVTLKLGAG